jgi:hypothetical protein
VLFDIKKEEKKKHIKKTHDHPQHTPTHIYKLVKNSASLNYLFAMMKAHVKGYLNMYYIIFIVISLKNPPRFELVVCMRIIEINPSVNHF